MKYPITIPMTNSGTATKDTAISKLYKSLLAEFKRELPGYSAIAIIPQSCIGSVAAMVLLIDDMDTVAKMSLLFLVTIFCMAYNGAVLAQLKPKITFNLLLLSLLFSFVIIIASLF